MVIVAVQVLQGCQLASRICGSFLRNAVGKKGAPLELNSYEEVLEWVAANPLGISYIDESMVDNSVKVLHTVYVFDDMEMAGDTP